MKSKSRSMIFCALFAALTAVCSQLVFYLPFTPVPLNLGLLAAFLAGGLLPRREAFLSQLAWVLLGLAGFPVFSGLKGGLNILAGPTGGFIIGFLFVALLVSIAVTKKGVLFKNLLFSMMVSLLVLYLFGAIWFQAVTKSTLATALFTCVLPFVPGDVLKILAASILVKKLRRHLGLR